MKTTKFLLKGLMFEVAYGNDPVGAEMRDDNGPLCFNGGEWILTHNYGFCPIAAFCDEGVVVPLWTGTRVLVDWPEVYDKNRNGSTYFERPKGDDRVPATLP